MTCSVAVKRSLRLFITAMIFAAMLAAAQENKQTPAPLPGPMVTATKVFISNGGQDPLFNFAPNRAYNQFYRGIQSWGKYELVSAPTDANLVFEVSLGDENVSNNSLLIVPLLKLTFLDPKTGIHLWTLTKEMKTGSHQDQKFDEAMDQLIANLKNLMTQSAPAPANH